MEKGVFGDEGWSIEISNPVVERGTSSTSTGMVTPSDAQRLQEDEEVSELGSISLLDNGVLSPTENSADLFRQGAGDIVGIPTNAYGSEESDVDGGKTYAGIVAYRPGRESSLISF